MQYYQMLALILPAEQARFDGYRPRSGQDFHLSLAIEKSQMVMFC
jgi:hypothetical protein